LLKRARWLKSMHYLFVCLFSWRYNGMWLYFHCPVTGFSLLVFDVFNHIQWRATVGRTVLEEWSIHRRDLYLRTHNTHNMQTSMPPVGFKLAISANERPKTYALDRTANGTGLCINYSYLLAIYTNLRRYTLHP
jgi:hypothetical protein